MFRLSKIQLYQRLLAERGIAEAGLLAGTGITANHLQAPGFAADLDQSQLIIANLIRLTDDQAIGLEAGRAMRLEDYGIISHAMMTSKTLEQAARYWVRYSNLVGVLIDIGFDAQENQWRVVFSPRGTIGFAFNFAVEEILLVGITLMEELTGRRAKLKELHLSYPAPLHIERYRSTFACPITFNSIESALTVLTPAIDTELPSRDSKLHWVYEQHCQEITRELGEQDPLVSELRKVFLQDSREAPSLDEASELMGLNPRTLRRRLEKHGTTYQNLINQFRLGLATEYFRKDQLNTDEVGELLGYSDANTFRRAFKSWTGKTVNQYRRDLLDGGGL